MGFPISCNFRLTVRTFLFRLIAFWTLGLLLGTLFAAGLDDSFFPLMRRFFAFPVSIVIHLILAVLPFLICTYAFMIQRKEIILAVLFCKAFSFSLLAFYAVITYGSAGWLMQPMLQFPDLLLMPVLIWFCLRNTRSFMRDHFICIGVAVAAVLIHYFAVLPFVAELIN